MHNIQTHILFMWLLLPHFTNTCTQVASKQLRCSWEMDSIHQATTTKVDTNAMELRLQRTLCTWRLRSHWTNCPSSETCSSIDVQDVNSAEQKETTKVYTAHCYRSPVLQTKSKQTSQSRPHIFDITKSKDTDNTYHEQQRPNASTKKKNKSIAEKSEQTKNKSYINEWHYCWSEK